MRQVDAARTVRKLPAAPGPAPRFNRRTCAWIVSDGKPWVFCDQPAAPGRSYCGDPQRESLGPLYTHTLAALPGLLTVTRSDLIAELAASHPHLRQADVELIVATVFDQITAALARGGRVELRGFGAFTVKQRNARIGHNLRTREKVPVEEKAVLFFKASRERHGRLNRGWIARQGRP